MLRSPGLLNRIRLALAFILYVLISNSLSAADFVHVRLQDRLDRPADGYCLDILGTGTNLRVDLPLFAHNCKQGPTPDSTMVFTRQGQLIFPAPNVCVTVFGVNNTVLPGTSVLLMACDEQSAFFDARRLQRFEYLKNGQFKLRGSELCLTVGDEASVTYSPHDRWRVLMMEACDKAPISHSAWEMVTLR